jgi:hypothetical protein
MRHSLSGDHLAILAPVSRCAVEMTQGHGEHASRRFHFVRDMHHQSLPDLRGQPYRLASQTSGCHSQDMLDELLSRKEGISSTRRLSEMSDKVDVPHCITSVPSLDKSPSPLRLFPPYPWPLTRCIQANSSRVRSIAMTASGLGLQQHGVFPIGAIAGELAIPQPPIRCALQRLLHSRAVCQMSDVLTMLATAECHASLMLTTGTLLPQNVVRCARFGMRWYPMSQIGAMAGFSNAVYTRPHAMKINVSSRPLTSSFETRLLMYTVSTYLNRNI